MFAPATFHCQPLKVDDRAEHTSAPMGRQVLSPMSLWCFCSMKMSPRNCSVSMSPHEGMGDMHDAPKGSPRARLPKAALAGKIPNADGALALHLSGPQCPRVTGRFAAERAAGLRHRRRGQTSPRRRLRPPPPPLAGCRPQPAPPRLAAPRCRGGPLCHDVPNTPVSSSRASPALGCGRPHAEPHAPVTPRHPLPTPSRGVTCSRNSEQDIFTGQRHAMERGRQAC